MEIQPSLKVGQEPALTADIVQLAKNLAKMGIEILKQNVDLETKVISGSDLGKLVRERTGATFSLWDNQYYYTTLASWQKIIDLDWSDEKKYVKERYDCDNYAYMFCSRMAEWFELNGAGIVLGVVRNPNTNALLGWHAWVFFLADVNGKPELFNLETETDQFVKVETGKPIVVGSWKYCPVWTIWY